MPRVNVDRLEASNQFANLARGSGDLARQLAEFGRRLGTVEVKVDTVVDRALATAQPLAAEIEELSTLVKQLADSVAAQEVAINNTALSLERRTVPASAVHAPAVHAPTAQAASPAPRRASAAPVPAPAATVVAVAPAPPAPPPIVDRKIAAFAGLDRDGIIAAIRRAIDAGRIDLYLQPVVTLAAAQGALLRSVVAAQSRQWRSRSRPTISWTMPRRAR